MIFSEFGQTLSGSSAREEQFWADYQKTFATVQPTASKFTTSGLTAEDLLHAYLDTGKWLSTGYGLAYQIEPGRSGRR